MGGFSAASQRSLIRAPGGPQRGLSEATLWSTVWVGAALTRGLPGSRSAAGGEVEADRAWGSMAYQADQTRAAASQSACLGLMFGLGGIRFPVWLVATSSSGEETQTATRSSSVGPKALKSRAWVGILGPARRVQTALTRPAGVKHRGTLFPESDKGRFRRPSRDAHLSPVSVQADLRVHESA